MNINIPLIIGVIIEILLGSLFFGIIFYIGGRFIKELFEKE
jgi:hypothetical protein